MDKIQENQAVDILKNMLEWSPDGEISLEEFKTAIVALHPRSRASYDGRAKEIKADQIARNVVSHKSYSLFSTYEREEFKKK